jgi:hypothetical protein
MRASTLVLVLSALAASVISAHPITGSNDGGDAYSGAAGWVRRVYSSLRSVSPSTSNILRHRQHPLTLFECSPSINADI